MIAAVITRGIGFGGVQFIPTHGFTSAEVVAIDRNVFTGASQNNVFTGATQDNQFAATKRGSVEGGIE